MTGNRAKEGERETERERADWGGRETTVVEGENGMGNQRRWQLALVDLTVGLNQHLGIFGDVSQYNNKSQ